MPKIMTFFEDSTIEMIVRRGSELVAGRFRSSNASRGCGYNLEHRPLKDCTCSLATSHVLPLPSTVSAQSSTSM